MSKLPNYINEEWRKIVIKARENIRGNCALIEDEAIVEVDKFLDRCLLNEARRIEEREHKK